MGLVSVALLIAATSVPADSPAQADPFPAWMHVTTHPRADAVAAWRAIRAVQIAKWRERGGPDELAEAVASISGEDRDRIRARVEELATAGDPLGYNALYEQIAWEHGEYAGYWQFFGDHGEDAGPTAAFRFDWPLTGATYSMPVEMYCDEARNGCDQVRAALSIFKALEPADPVLFEQWTRIVAEEACEQGPAKMEAKGSDDPSRTGRVLVYIRTNRCGEVRDAWLAESSGDEELDRKAVNTARRWRVEMPVVGEGEVQNIFRVPLTYGGRAPLSGD